jgi:hypothetical protein
MRRVFSSMRIATSDVRCVLLDCGDRDHLQRRTPKGSGLTRTTVVEGHKGVARKHELHELTVEPGPQIERARGPLARATCNQEHRAKRQA